MKLAPARFLKVLRNGWFWWLVALSIYFGSYLNLRVREVFIHRAGSYAIDPLYFVGERNNHFIEPGELDIDIDLEGIIQQARTPFAADPFSDEDEDWEPTDYEILQLIEQEIKPHENARQRLFGFFIPAAFVETWIWKLVEPHPLQSRNP